MAKNKPLVKLNDKHRLFVAEYLKDQNGTQAVIRAGFAENGASVTACRLLLDPKISEMVERGKAKRMEAVKIDAEYVLRQSVKLHERCMSEISPVMVREGKDWVHDTDEDGNKLFKFDASGAAKGLELIGKHITVQSFNEKKSLTLDLETATTEELEAELAALMRDEE